MPDQQAHPGHRSERREIQLAFPSTVISANAGARRSAQAGTSCGSTATALPQDNPAISHIHVRITRSGSDALEANNETASGSVRRVGAWIGRQPAARVRQCRTSPGHSALAPTPDAPTPIRFDSLDVRTASVSCFAASLVSSPRADAYAESPGMPTRVRGSMTRDTFPATNRCKRVYKLLKLARGPRTSTERGLPPRGGADA